MGNRAVITTKENFENNGIGVYLHWNGGRDSVNAFLAYCKLRDFRVPDEDCHGFARLCQVVGNYFGADLIIGVDTLDRLDCDNGDNGVYIIKGWDIVDRKFFDGEEQDKHNLNEMLKEIDESQPEGDRLGEILESIEIPTSEVEIGDIVYTKNFFKKFEKHVVIGFRDTIGSNGINVKVPYTDEFGGLYSNIYTKTVRIKKRKV